MASKGKQLSELLDANGDVLQVNLDNVVVNPAAVSDKENTSTGGFTMPAGTTAQRPGSPDTGESRYNSDIGSLEFYDGTTWIATNLIPTVDSVTGEINDAYASTLTLSLSNATDSIDVIFKEGGVDVATVTDVTVTAGSATVTVPAAVYGQTAGDTITVHVNNNDGTPSSNSQSKTVIAAPSGGTISTATIGGTDYRIHTFTSSGNFVTNETVSANYLLVAGGGGGGAGRHAGGAGAGGLIHNIGSSAVSMTSGTYPVVIGAGGSAPITTGSVNGSDSTFNGWTAVGGGRGGSHGLTGTFGGGGVGATDLELGGNGGSGGGSGHTSGKAAGTGTAGQGNAGSRAVPDRSVLPSGGGRGSAGVTNGSGGETTSTGKGDDGGAGLQVNVDGNNHYYAGGGGGSGSAQSPGYLGAWGGGAGGIGGGGGGASSGGSGSYGGAGGGSARNSGATGTATQTNNACHGGNGGANTGGGGGAAAGWSSTGNGNGGTGGSGVMIIRYAI